MPMLNILLLAAGIFLVVLGLLMLLASGAGGRGEVEGGGVVLIGPIPIIFGGSSIKLLLISLIIFMAIFALLAFLSVQAVV